ncbi:MAG: hypothetical protein WD972_00215 [Candidatus Andersenbacteria bacterium]
MIVWLSYRLFSGVSWLIVLLALPVITHAQNSGVSISPAFQEVIVTPEAPQQPFTVRLTNNTAVEQTVRLSVLDFGQLQESGGIAFLGTDIRSLEQKYGLASWLSLERDVLSISPGETAELTTTIINKESLSPGGHYAALVATFSDEQDVVEENVSLQQALSSLVFVRKVGGEVYGLTVAGVQTDTAWLSLPTTVQIRFHNNGNVHVVPRGRVEVRDAGDRLVAKGIINEASALVLPESFRVLPVDIKEFVSPFRLRPGQYRLVVDYRYDGNEVFTREEQSFLYLGTATLATGLLLLLGVLSILKKLFIK